MVDKPPRLDMVSSLREECLYSEFFCSVFTLVWTEHRDLRSKSPYSVQMREKAELESSKYGHFLRSDTEVYLGTCAEGHGR